MAQCSLLASISFNKIKTVKLCYNVLQQLRVMIFFIGTKMRLRCKDREQIRILSARKSLTYNLTLKFIRSYHTTKTTFVPLLQLGSLFQNFISLVNNSNEVTKEGSLIDILPQQ